MTAEQWTEQQLQAATPEQVTGAFKAGYLAELLGARVPNRPEPGTQLSVDDLAGMTSDDVTLAFQQGNLDALLGRNGHTTG